MEWCKQLLIMQSNIFYNIDGVPIVEDGDIGGLYLAMRQDGINKI